MSLSHDDMVVTNLLGFAFATVALMILSLRKSAIEISLRGKLRRAP
jgi:hypothetical protein